MAKPLDFRHREMLKHVLDDVGVVEALQAFCKQQEEEDVDRLLNSVVSPRPDPSVQAQLGGRISLFREFVERLRDEVVRTVD